MGMADFSLELNEDQQQVQKWVHDFAENVVRPVAHEWDEREESPWPVIEEAARSACTASTSWPRRSPSPTGLMLPVAARGAVLGRRRHRAGHLRFGPAAAGISGNGTPEQVLEWVPQCFGTPDDVKLGAFCVSEPDAGSDVSSLRTRAVYDEAKDEWVLHGTKAWITNGGIADVHVVVAAVDPALRAGARRASSCRRAPGLSQGQKYAKHGIRASHTAEVVLDDVRVPGRCLLGGKEQARGSWPGPARAAIRARSSRPWRRSRRPAPPWARRRSGSPGPPTSTRSTTPRSARRSAADHHEPGHRLQARRHAPWRSTRPGCSCGGRRGWPATAAFTAGEGSMSKLKAGEIAVWVTEQAIQILGGYGYIREYPVERWHRDAKIYTIFEGTSEIQRLVIARAISGLRVE